MVSRVSVLFRGQPDLIVGLNCLLPPDYSIETSDQGQSSGIIVKTPEGRHRLVDGRLELETIPTPSVQTLPSAAPGKPQSGRGRGRKRASQAPQNGQKAKKSKQELALEQEEDQLRKHIRETGLPLRFRAPTLGDGNCFYRAVCDQVHYQYFINLSLTLSLSRLCCLISQSCPVITPS